MSIAYSDCKTCSCHCFFNCLNCYARVCIYISISVHFVSVKFLLPKNDRLMKLQHFISENQEYCVR